VGSAQLVYRIVREGLLNVAEHSRASRAWVRVHVFDTRIDVTVSDNGSAPHDAAVAERESGHFGLRLLRDAVTDLGGELTTTSAASGGTVLRGWFPVPDTDG
jgi:signal transduction histidine kinase